MNILKWIAGLFKRKKNKVVEPAKTTIEIVEPVKKPKKRQISNEEINRRIRKRERIVKRILGNRLTDPANLKIISPFNMVKEKVAFDPTTNPLNYWVRAKAKGGKVYWKKFKKEGRVETQPGNPITTALKTEQI